MEDQWGSSFKLKEIKFEILISVFPNIYHCTETAYKDANTEICKHSFDFVFDGNILRIVTGFNSALFLKLCKTDNWSKRVQEMIVI